MRDARIEVVRGSQKSGFGGLAAASESGFFRLVESAFGSLEKPPKTPIYSITC
jgi:hypothetical protein